MRYVRCSAILRSIKAPAQGTFAHFGAAGSDSRSVRDSGKWRFDPVSASLAGVVIRATTAAAFALLSVVGAHAGVRVSVTPGSVLVDDPVTVRVTGLRPRSRVT